MGSFGLTTNRESPEGRGTRAVRAFYLPALLAGKPPGRPAPGKKPQWKPENKIFVFPRQYVISKEKFLCGLWAKMGLLKERDFF